MNTVKTIGLAIGLAFATCSFAFAQQGNPPQQGSAPAQVKPPAKVNPAEQGNPANNAAASGGSGTHQNSTKTGTAENSEKVLRNRQGYRRVYRHVYSYYRHGRRCHAFHRRGRLVTICR